ncbi:hypothetical protein [Methanobrevibacter wolinii]|uniref:hypothetical protein n=1 Tax=Methanobrevibacter wolinii TaxID=190977 RepID=UPI0005B2DDA0|nr:hypothetical protein [Methanobrevibacter wolinii]MDD5959671.1 hypothetical protein [Methanobrevibacter wolinii]
MINNVDELREKAMENKPELKRERIKIPIGDDEYEFNIAGVGEKSIILRKFVKYDDIMDAIEAGNDTGLEKIVLDFIDEFETKEDEE